MEIVAHRGASLDAPEHTFEAYDLALEQGADALEVDLRACADGKLVAVHDPTLRRTTGLPHAVADVRRAELPIELRPLKLGMILRRYRRATRFLLELKDPVAPMERRLVAAIANTVTGKRVVVQSFDLGGLRRVRRLDRRLPLAPLTETRPTAAWLDRCVALEAVAVGVHRAAVDAALVGAVHARGLGLRVFTVNDPAEAAHLAGLGVDGLITDAPGAIRAALLADLVGPRAA